MAEKETPKPGKKKNKKLFWIFRLSILGILIAGFTVVALFVINVAEDLPDLRDIENPENDLSTQIYSADGVLIRNIYDEKHRVSVSLDEISPNVLNALIATEDIRFYQHSGIDPTSVLAVVKDFVTGRKTRGGSTITMQLARNLYDKIGRERTIRRKLAEVITAVVLERKFTKDEIISSYLNTVSFFGNTYGIQNAARTFFQKDAIDLNIAESAMLIGLLKGPSQYNPVNHYEAGLERRNVILSQMEKYDFISSSQADSLKDLPIDLSNFKKDNHNLGLAPYFTEHLRQWLKEWCKDHGYNLYRDGLRVYTTIDSRMQKYGEVAVEEHLSGLQQVFDKRIKGREPWRRDTTFLVRAVKKSYRYIKAKRSGKSWDQIWTQFQEPVKMRIFAWKDVKGDTIQDYDTSIDTMMSPMDSIRYYSRFLEPGFIAIDPHNGHIKCWVGGLDHQFFQYDHVYQGKRQVGSTFKPFVYTTAIDNGYSPCDLELNQPISIPHEDGTKKWTPKNSDGKFGGYMTLRRGLATSTNLITIRLIIDVTPEQVCQYARNMGIQSKLDCVPSLALGTTDLSVHELTGAYCTFANKGVWNEPIFVTRIEDKNGNILEKISGEKREAIPEQTAYKMLSLLMGVVDERGGTAGRLRFRYKFKNQIGGKTGTTQNHSDGWFMGVTPNLVGGVWVGCSDRTMRFRSLRYGQGAEMALPIFALFMKDVYADSTIAMPQDPFEKPKGMSRSFNCDDYEYKNPRLKVDSAGIHTKSILDFD